MGDSRGSRDGQKAPAGAKDGSASRSRNRLVPLLLLFVRDEGSYDSRLQEKLGELGLDGTGPEEMYRTLWKMEREGMVVCNRDGSGFKIPRRWYEITGAGRTYLESWANSLRGHQGEIDLFLKTYADGSARETR